MNDFDDNGNRIPPPATDAPAAEPLEQNFAAAPFDAVSQPAPLSYTPRPPRADRLAFLPADLRVYWSWPHVIVFVSFGFASLLFLQIAAVLYLSGLHRRTQKELEQLFESKPQFLLGTNLLWVALLFLFLYVTLTAIRRLPFWQSLGWRKIEPGTSRWHAKPWMFFIGGAILAVLVGLGSSLVHTPDTSPIQEIFKNRTGALVFMAMAVIVAPLVEETIFRGYMYPFLAGKFTSFAVIFGAPPLEGLRFGTGSAILLTGALFGLMHGGQLGWTFGLVFMLTLVGIIFTYVRARTGTVWASYLLHLGYNSMITLTSLVATKGFTHMPPHGP